jgi:hypothetical protein
LDHASEPTGVTDGELYFGDPDDRFGDDCAP